MIEYSEFVIRQDSGKYYSYSSPRMTDNPTRAKRYIRKCDAQRICNGLNYGQSIKSYFVYERKIKTNEILVEVENINQLKSEIQAKDTKLEFLNKIVEEQRKHVQDLAARLNKLEAIHASYGSSTLDRPIEEPEEPCSSSPWGW
jgi:predicted RNase H-like nuclease (RuvC/YqgF family)